MLASKKTIPKRLNSEERRMALLDAAAETFVKYGYTDTSLDLIIKRAGGSKRSIYTEFGGKKELFIALVTENANKVLTSLPRQNCNGSDLRATLLSFAENVLKMLFTPMNVNLFRMVLMDGNRFPELVGKYFQAGPDKAVIRLAEIFENARQKGEIKISDSKLAAAHLVGMLRGNWFHEVMLQRHPIPGEDEIREFVTVAVDIFLDGIR